MKPVVRFRPKMFLQRDEFAALAWVGSLVLLEGWNPYEASLRACDYYEIDNPMSIYALYTKLVGEQAYTVVEVPNKLKKCEINEYLKRKF